MKSKKGIVTDTILKLIFLTVVISVLGTVYLVITLSHKENVEHEEYAINQMRKTGLAIKTISAKECLSVGDIGILNHTLLEEKNGTSNLACIRNPRTHYQPHVKVKNEETGGIYSFGEKDEDEETKTFNFDVGIEKDSGVERGIANITFVKTTETPPLSQACELESTEHRWQALCCNGEPIYCIDEDDDNVGCGETEEGCDKHRYDCEKVYKEVQGKDVFDHWEFKRCEKRVDDNGEGYCHCEMI